MATEEPNIEDAAREEVLALHRFLDAWLKGKAPKGGGGPDRLADALSDDFVVIHPSGTRATKSDVVAAFAAAHGSKPNTYALRVGGIETRRLCEHICLAIYEEWHEGEPGRARLSSAILRRRAAGRGLEWCQLQETPAPHLEPKLAERPA